MTAQRDYPAGQQVAPVQGAMPLPLLRRMTRALGRMALAVRYLLTQRHRHRRLTLERVGDHRILVLPDVFNPVLFKSGAFLAETLTADVIPSGARVLDMGTGTGIGAIAAARLTDRIVAVDVNPEPVRCARINALLNGSEERIDVRHGNLFEPLGHDERFDVVLFNPPYFRGEPADSYDHAWRSVDVVERFAAGLKHHLAGNGCACVVLSSDGESRAFLEAFRRNGYRVELLAERPLINETLTVYRIFLDRRGDDADSL